ncbi:MAG: histidine--tRNA ligase [Candidatus Latescibacterota bacterium]|nr:histidine--tRNA ligase [Candidatus Latescibacterota bacterium]
MNTSPPRGTRDFFPEDMRLQSWLLGHFRESARIFGFEEYDTPVVESEELYVRKQGEEIVDQLYTFEDKSGRRLALRPEMTPSLARLVIQRGSAIALPLKWFSIPQCWRYERMSRGRRREHYQWNVDIFGVEGPAAEIELIAVLTTFFGRVGIASEDVIIRVSSRRILEAVLADAGVSEELYVPVCLLVDKLEKIPREEVESQVRELGIDPEIVGRIIDVVSLDSLEAVASEVDEERAGIADVRELFALAKSYGVADWLRFDPSLVRGLAYYTGLVFEAFDRGGDLRAICGGGRYDRLLSNFGGKDIPACGFGFGDAVIVELLKDKQLIPDPAPDHVDDVVFAFSEELRSHAMAVAARLRAGGRAVDLVLERGKRMKWAFRHADNVGAARLMLLAPDEWERGAVRVCDLESGQEKEVALDAIT